MVYGNPFHNGLQFRQSEKITMTDISSFLVNVDLCPFYFDTL